jgi:hypothetical protein
MGEPSGVFRGSDGPANPFRQARWEVHSAQLDPDDLSENPPKFLALVAREASGHMVLEVPSVFHGELAVEKGIEAPKDLVAVNHGPGHAPS